MKITQIVYKVDDLERAAARASEKGLAAEYGRKRKPYNAFIYFEDETFVELIENTGIPAAARIAMKAVNRKFIGRFEKWDRADEGPLGIGIQVTERQMREIKAYLKKKYGICCFRLTSRRRNIHGMDFVAKCLFPENTFLPFFVTPYRDAEDAVLHRNLNGNKRVKHIEITLPDKEYEIASDLQAKFRLWEEAEAGLRRGGYGFQVTVSDTLNMGIKAKNGIFAGK